VGTAADPGEKPEPETDAPPDDGPGGPADMVRDEEGPPEVADQPRSAQVEDQHVPDEIEEPEDKDKDVQKDEKNVDEGTEDVDEDTDEPA
jgi:hypothetical protein